MNIVKYFFISIVACAGLAYSVDRSDSILYDHTTTKRCILFKKNKKKKCMQKSESYRKRYVVTFLKNSCKKSIGRPFGRPGGYGWPTSPLSAGPFDGNSGTGNNFFDSLAAMAPIAIAMYCFNSAPRLTMVTLTTLLLFIAGSSNE